MAPFRQAPGILRIIAGRVETYAPVEIVIDPPIGIARRFRHLHVLQHQQPLFNLLGRVGHADVVGGQSDSYETGHAAADLIRGRTVWMRVIPEHTGRMILGDGNLVSRRTIDLLDRDMALRRRRLVLVIRRVAVVDQNIDIVAERLAEIGPASVLRRDDHAVGVQIGQPAAGAGKSVFQRQINRVAGIETPHLRYEAAVVEISVDDIEVAERRSAACRTQRHFEPIVAAVRLRRRTIGRSVQIERPVVVIKTAAKRSGNVAQRLCGCRNRGHQHPYSQNWNGAYHPCDAAPARGSAGSGC